MKRTGEIVLSIIGIIFYGFMAAIGGLLIWLENNKEFVQEMVQDAAEQNPEAPAVTMEDFDMVMDMAGTSGMFLFIVSIIAMIVGIIAVVFLKGNKKPKAAGILLIVTAVVVAIITIGGGIFSGILYLIAGIMCLARKPQKIIYE